MNEEQRSLAICWVDGEKDRLVQIMGMNIAESLKAMDECIMDFTIFQERLVLTKLSIVIARLLAKKLNQSG
jgi:hypothetical protein